VRLARPGGIRAVAAESLAVKHQLLIMKRARELMAGQIKSVDELARRENLDARTVRRLLGLGFLSPRIMEAIIEGNQPPELTVIELSRRVDLPLLWSAQEEMLLATQG